MGSTSTTIDCVFHPEAAASLEVLRTVEGDSTRAIGRRRRARGLPPVVGTARLAFCLFVVASLGGCSCSDTHSRDDAGVPDAVSTDAAIAPIDAAAVLDAASDTPTPDAGPRCALAAPSSTLVGTSPLGAVSFPYAWAGRGNTSKACFGVALHATDTAALNEQPTRSLWMWLPRPSTEPIVGRHTGVTVMLELEGMTAMTSVGVVDVTAYTRDDASPAVEASVDVVGDGFDVHGTLAVPYCEIFADPCI